MRLPPKPEDFLILRIMRVILSLGLRAENAIRPFVMGRKAWLFADTKKGATSSAIVYSIVETAKANNLNVYKYLTHIFTKMPAMDFKNNPSLLEDLLPWSAKLPEDCRNNKNQ
jgi:transposase